LGAVARPDTQKQLVPALSISWSGLMDSAAAPWLPCLPVVILPAVDVIHSWLIADGSLRDRARLLTCCCCWGGAEACHELRPKVLVPRPCQIQGVGGARTHDKSPCRAARPRRYGLRASQRRLAAAPGYCTLPVCSCCALTQEHGCVERDLRLIVACQVL
jgi:hypothetical protein